MKRIKVKIIGEGVPEDPYRIDLPTCTGLQFDTDKGKKPPAAKAIIDIPNWMLTIDGRIDKAILKEKYKGQKWEDHTPDIGEVEPLESLTSRSGLWSQQTRRRTKQATH